MKILALKEEKTKVVIGAKLYDTEKAQVVAGDRYWDGSNWERHGRSTLLSGAGQ